MAKLYQADLDTIPTAIQRLLAELGQVGQTTPDQLKVGFDGQTIPVDWWLWRHKLIEFKGLDIDGNPLLGLSPAGASIARDGATWFAAPPKVDPSSECAGLDGIASAQCDLKITFTPVANALGRTVLSGGSLPTQTVSDSASSEGGVWQADAIDYGPGEQPQLAILTLMMGSAEEKEAAHQVYLTELTDAVSAARNRSGFAASLPSDQVQGN